MKEYGKKVLFWSAVILVSAGVSAGTYQLLDRTNAFHNATDSMQQFAKPVGYDMITPGSGVQTDFTKAAEMTVNAVVHIKSTTMATDRISGDPFFDLFFGNRGQGQPKPKVGYGSGVIISSDGYIVTNNHVIDGSDEVDVTLNDKRQFRATVVGTDPATDIALLKVEEKELPVIKFGDSDKLLVGEWVLAVGNPFMLNSTVTAGIVSAKARSIGIMSSSSKLGIESFIQTDAAVNPGNSGGALVNTNGELIGINTAIFSETGNYAGYSFAVPSSIVSKVVTDLKQYGTVQRAVLGIAISDINAELAKEKNLTLTEGVYVGGVNDNSAAALAGIKEGDVITAINGVKVKNVAQLQEQVNRYRPGDKIQVTYNRFGKSDNASVVLKNQIGNTDVVKQQGVEVLGASYRELDDKTRAKLGIRNGVQVESVKDGLFKTAGIQNGFIIVKINDIRITSAKDIEKVYKELTVSTRSTEREPVMFIAGIYPNGKTAYYAIDLTQ
ncbi:MAG: Do family serine endopeptidase [Bacteroidales bacterium]